LLHPRPLEASLPGLALTVLASLINPFLGLHLARRGRELRSPALVADGQHMLSDVWSSLLVLVGVVLAIVSGWTWLDPLIGLLVALLVLRVGWGVVRGALGGLLDEALPDEDAARLRATIERFRADYLEVHDLRARRAGRDVFVDFHLVLPSGMVLARAHDLCDAIEDALRAELPGASITIHVEPELLAHGTLSDRRL
ncbi:MAG: cation diffusion facilitator family transporter, partial [Deinococcus sp.]